MDSPDAMSSFLGKRLLLSFNPSRGIAVAAHPFDDSRDCEWNSLARDSANLLNHLPRQKDRLT
jgi:hypothetical protein